MVQVFASLRSAQDIRPPDEPAPHLPLPYHLCLFFIYQIQYNSTCYDHHGDPLGG